MRRTPLALFALLLWATPAGTLSVAPGEQHRPVGSRSFATTTSPGEWTWVAGPSRVAESALLGAYGTKGVADPGNAPGARRGAVTWRDESGNLWVFGGYGAADRRSQDDLWRWDGETWTWVSGEPPWSSALARVAAASWVDHAGRFWLFGGSNERGERLNDLWRWDGTNWAWMAGSESASAPGVYGTLGTPAPQNVPGARWQAASWTAADGSLWLFGGWGHDSERVEGLLQDLWTYAPPECPSPDGTITAPDSVLADSGGNPASVPDAGAGATYAWSIAGGTIVSGDGTRTITFSVHPDAKTVWLHVTVRVGDCASTAVKTILASEHFWLEVRRNGPGIVYTKAGDFADSCPDACRTLVPRGAWVILDARPQEGFRLDGWTGVACAEETRCTFTMIAPTTVTATFGPVAQPGSFYTVDPCRVVDTREPAGPFGAPALAPDTSRPDAIGGACGVPADAKAVVLNVTAVGPTHPGSLTVSPGLSTAPDTTVVAFAAGSTRAGNASVGLVDGVLSVLDRQQAGTVDLVLDVSGYFR